MGGHGAADGDGPLVAVLGAGAAIRMGGGKLDSDLGGRPLGAWAVSAALGLGGPVCVIARAGPCVWGGEGGRGVERVVNADAGAGMASSLVLAAGMAQRQERSLLVMLADMPFLATATLRRLAGAAEDAVVACRYPDGRLGPAAWFGARRLADLRGLVGDRGARDLLNRAGFAEGIAVDPAELCDIDTPEDLRRARLWKASRR